MSVAALLIAPTVVNAEGVCSVQNGINNIGIEYTADTCPAAGDNDSTTHHYIDTLITCVNGKVHYEASYGDSTTTPASLQQYGLNNSYNVNKVFRNSKGTHFILVHKSYTGTIEGVNIGTLANKQVYTDVIKKVFFGAGGAASNDLITCNYPPPPPPVIPPRDLGQCKTCPANTATTNSAANLKSGNYYHSQTVIAKPESLSFDISYNSLDTTDLPLGRGWTHGYNISLKESSSAITLRLGDGDNLVFTLSGSSYLPPANSSDDSVIVKNSDSTYTRTFKNGLVQSFNNSGLLTAVTDSNGNKTVITYNGSYLSSITDPVGRKLTFTVTNGYITAIADPAGRTTSFTYTSNLLNKVTDPAGNSWNYVYDSNSRMSQKTNPEGFQSTNVYDAAGKNSAATDPEGRTKYITYTDSTTSTITEKDGGIWIRKYDPTLNAPTAITDPLGNTTSYTYDSKGNLLTRTEPGSKTTSYTYDADNNTTSITDPLGRVTSFTYNSRGQVLTATDPKGNVTSNSYDTKGNLLQTTDPASAVVSYSYDSKGNPLTITDPAGKVVTIAYDTYNNISSITDQNNNTTTYSYDINGNLLTATNPAGKAATVEYDTMNRPVKITDSLGNISQLAYDKIGNRSSITDANGRSTNYTYNYNRQPLTVKNPLNHTTALAYSGSGCASCGGGGNDKLVSLTDPLANSTSYEYDKAGRLTRQTDPKGNATAYSYTANGIISAVTDANSKTITYTRDAADRITSKNWPDNSSISYTYDNNDNILTATNSNIGYSFTYDNRNRILTATDSRGYNIAYTYDINGNRLTATINKTGTPAKTTTYSYDDANRLTSITSPAGSFSYSYDNNNRRTGLNYPNNSKATYSHDDADRLTAITHTKTDNSIITKAEYTLDKTGNRTAKTGSTNETYSYDAIYRLTQAATPKGYETYNYDANGNRTQGPGPHDTRYQHEAANQLVKGKQYSYTHDNNGNPITKTTNNTDKNWTYTWDPENRLIKAELTNKTDKRTITFKYDPFGRRTEKQTTITTNGNTKTTTTNYIYDNDNIAVETTATTENGTTTNTTTNYTHGITTDEHLAMERNGQYYYYHTDGLGSTTAITDNNGNTVQSYSYTTFGIPRQTTDFKNSYTFTGREWDRETALHYYRARYYDPVEGRFISRDPISFAGGDVNLYGYVQGNPVNWVDPDGLIAIPWISVPLIPITGKPNFIKPGPGPDPVEWLKNNYNSDNLVVQAWRYWTGKPMLNPEIPIPIQMAKGGIQNKANEYSREASQQPDPCNWLIKQYNNASSTAERMKIKTAQKVLGCRKNSTQNDKCKEKK